MNIDKTNYHTHTFRCQHATGEVQDYCEAAANAHMVSLGMADHTPLPDGKWGAVRMAMDELPGYCAKIAEAKKEFAGTLNVYSGLECEYFPRYARFFEDVLKGESGIEYLAMGLHFYPYRGEEVSTHYTRMDVEALTSYTDLLVDAIKTGIFAFVTHPDLFLSRYPGWDKNASRNAERICKASADYNVPLEINGFGFGRKDFTGYPNFNFWKMAAEHGVKALVNSDAHKPEDIDICYDKCYKIAEGTGIELIDIGKRIARG